MKGNWTQILVFTVLSLILGFVLGRVTGKGHHGEQMEKRIIKHRMGGDEHMVWNDNDGMTERVFIEEDEDAMRVSIEALEGFGFEGDTIIDGANVNITRDGEEVRVEVKKEMGESGKRIKKRIEIEREVEED